MRIPRRLTTERKSDKRRSLQADTSRPPVFSLGVLLGGRREVRSDTSWTHAFIDDDRSNRLYAVPAGDFNAPIGPAHFREPFLPEISRETEGGYNQCAPSSTPWSKRGLSGFFDVPMPCANNTLRYHMTLQAGRFQVT